jgi:hypothetical protein
MRGHWRKLGLLFDPTKSKRHPKLATHAANPLPVPLHGSIYRVFYSGRDSQNRSSVGAVDIDIAMRRIVREHYEPAFVHGPEASFFCDGVSIGSTIDVGGRTLMYFMGWKNQQPHWYGEIGALEVHDNLELSLAFTDPVLPRSTDDPISLSYPWVVRQHDGSLMMWYGSTSTWDAGNGEMLHVICSAVSVDGCSWRGLGPALPYALGQAQAFSRPTVLSHADGSLDMWFAYRSGNGSTYRIGRAKSRDGGQWALNLEDPGIDVSDSGWDSEMIEYPYVFSHANETYMLYNGNGYGRTGFGLAVWASDED